MNLFPLVVPVLIGALTILSGCATFLDERYVSSAREETEFETLNTSVRQLQERVSGLETSFQRVYEDVDRLRDASDREKQELKDSIAGVEGRLKAAEAAFEAMRLEIVSDLGKRIEQVLSSRRSAQPRRETGYEHVVQSGETLSAISLAYKVTVDAVMRANNLKDPNSLRAGQKLFIPE